LLTDCRTHGEARQGIARETCTHHRRRHHLRCTHDHASPRSASGARTISASGARTGESRRNARYNHRAAAEPTVAWNTGRLSVAELTSRGNTCQPETRSAAGTGDRAELQLLAAESTESAEHRGIGKWSARFRNLDDRGLRACQRCRSA
jgi:hypothetical protein